MWNVKPSRPCIDGSSLYSDLQLLVNTSLQVFPVCRCWVDEPRHIIALDARWCGSLHCNQNITMNAPLQRNVVNTWRYILYLPKKTGVGFCSMAEWKNCWKRALWTLWNYWNTSNLCSWWDNLPWLARIRRRHVLKRCGRTEYMYSVKKWIVSFVVLYTE